MITGHFGLAYIAGAARRDARLPLLLAAAVLPDILDFAYAAVRFCSPLGLYSHSLPVLVPLAALAFAVGLATSRSAGAGLAMAAVVLLHLPADLLTGEKMLWPGGPIVGLQLYKQPLVDFAIELPLIVGGWALLRRAPSGSSWSTGSNAPRWATSALALVALIAVQGAMDGMKLTGKPTGCVAGTVAP